MQNWHVFPCDLSESTHYAIYNFVELDACWVANFKLLYTIVAEYVTMDTGTWNLAFYQMVNSEGF